MLLLAAWAPLGTSEWRDSKRQESERNALKQEKYVIIKGDIQKIRQGGEDCSRISTFL